MKGSLGINSKLGFSGKLGFTGSLDIGNPILDPSLLFSYDFSKANIAQAIKDSLEPSCILGTIRASSTYVNQNEEELIAFPDNTPAFKKGVGILNEGSATNEILDSEEPSAVFQESSISATTLAGFSGKEYTANSANGGHGVRHIANGLSNSTDYTISALVESTETYFALNFQNAAATSNHHATAVFNIKTGELTDTSRGASSGTVVSVKCTSLGGNTYLVEGTFSLLNVGATTNCYLLLAGEAEPPVFAVGGNPLFTTTGTESFKYAVMQCELGLDASSRIETSGSAVTRGFNALGLPVSTALCDAEHGLSGTTSIDLTGTKYDGQGSASWIGAAFIDSSTGGPGATVTASPDAQTLTIDAPVETTDILWLGNSGFTLSTAKTLRTNVGDSGFTDMPGTNYEIECNLTLQETIDALCNIFFTIEVADIESLLLVDSTTIRYETDFSAVKETINLTIPEVSKGSKLNCKIRRTSTDVTLTVNGVSSTLASTRSMPRDNYMLLGSAVLGIEDLNAYYEKFQVKEINS